MTGSRYLVPLGAAVFGGLLLAMALTYLSVELPPEWLPRVSRRRFRRWVVMSGGTLAVLLAGGEAVYLFA